MGLFNSVYAKCPECGELIEFQSKAGNTECSTFSLSAVPIEIAQDIIGEIVWCDCGNSVKLRVKPVSVETVELEEY